MPFQIFDEIITVYSNSVMNYTNVCKWCQEFRAVRMNVYDKQRSKFLLMRKRVETDKKYFFTDEIVNNIDKIVMAVN